MSKQAFGKLLGERTIERHYGPEEREEDLRYARGEENREDKASAV
jgi:predicted HTH domain antitoxin